VKSQLYDDVGPPVYVRGYASVFNRLYDIGNGVMERVHPGAFDLSGGIFVTFDHDHDRRFAHTGDKSLALWQDSVGLGFQFKLPGTWGGLSLARWVANNTFRGVSVHFISRVVDRKREGTLAVDDVLSARISEVSVTPTPANAATAVWTTAEDPAALPAFVADARARWQLGRMALTVAASRSRAKARAAGAPRDPLLRQVDRILARHRPGLLPGARR
jgi:HK97 family phage prohead protease